MTDALVVACGDAMPPALAGSLAVERVPARPGRDALDPLLGRLGERRLVVAGTDADLAAVVLRLLRTERLGTVPVGYVPARPDESAAAAAFGLPAQLDQALRIALHGDPDPVPVIRDDAGGVLVGLGVIRPLRGVVYCDDDQVLRGQASRMEVAPDPAASPDTSADGLVVRVWRGGLFRRGHIEARGRAVQIGCVPTRPMCDGVAYERQVRRWTWYRHTEDLRLIRGLV
jgi:hypothetical protein